MSTPSTMPLYTCGMVARNNAPHMWAHQNSGPRATSCLMYPSQNSGRRLSVWSSNGEGCRAFILSTSLFQSNGCGRSLRSLQTLRVRLERRPPPLSTPVAWRAARAPRPVRPPIRAGLPPGPPHAVRIRLPSRRPVTPAANRRPGPAGANRPRRLGPPFRVASAIRGASAPPLLPASNRWPRATTRGVLGPRSSPH